MAIHQDQGSHNESHYDYIMMRLLSKDHSIGLRAVFDLEAMIFEDHDHPISPLDKIRDDFITRVCKMTQKSTTMEYKPLFYKTFRSYEHTGIEDVFLSQFSACRQTRAFIAADMEIISFMFKTGVGLCTFI